MNYYKRLKDIREDKDLKQEDIARILNIKQTQYSRYELGKNRMPIDYYVRLAMYYNITLDYIVGLIDEPKPLPKK